MELTAINVAPNKLDVHVGHAIDVAVDFVSHDDGALLRRATVGLHVTNPIDPSGHNFEMVGSDLRETAVDSDGPLGLSRTWFTAWAPASSTFLGVTTKADDMALFGSGQIHGHAAADFELEVPSGSEDGVEVRLEGPAQLTAVGPDLTYSLEVWRQAKAIPDRVVLTIEAPEGWTVGDASVVGGGDGSGLGPFGDTGPSVELATTSTLVSVRGDVSSDLRVTVRFTRALTTRAWEWLRAPVVGWAVFLFG